jgi:hypothetical protein
VQYYIQTDKACRADEEKFILIILATQSSHHADNINLCTMVDTKTVGLLKFIGHVELITFPERSYLHTIFNTFSLLVV